MGIDRISSRPPSIPVTEQHLPSPGGTEATTFASTLAGSVESSAKIEAPATALQQLQAGQIDRATYLDLKVREATMHLTGLPSEQLSSLRTALRHRLTTDPALVDLARVATGRGPEVPTDD
jgi:hypothetical protein